MYSLITRFVIILIGTASILLVTGCGKKAYLSGGVIDDEGMPIVGAEVQTVGTTFLTKTDSDGTYRVGYVPGNVTLRIFHPDYTSHSQTLTIATETTYPAANIVLHRLPTEEQASELLNIFFSEVVRSDTRLTEAFDIGDISDIIVSAVDGGMTLAAKVTFISKSDFTWSDNIFFRSMRMDLFKDIVCDIKPGDYLKGDEFVRLITITLHLSADNKSNVEFNSQLPPS